MPDINELGLEGEVVGEIDSSAPEQGNFPPPLYVGIYDFLFKLEDDPFNAIEIDGAKYLQVRYVAEVVSTPNGAPALNAQRSPIDASSSAPTLRFQQASFYRSEKMRAAGMNSMAAELLRALGIRVDGKLTKEAVNELLRQQDGRGRFRAVVGWRAYFRDTDTTISTAPNKRRGDLPWPKSSEGYFVPEVADPQTGERRFGDAQIIRFRLPERGE